MVSLKMETDEDFHGIQSNNKSSVFEQSEILSKQINGKNPKVIIISGDAGSGKTTLLHWILEKWHKDMALDINDLSYDILLYMEFRRHDFNNFNDYLKDALEDLVANFGVKRVRSSILLTKCLILCDGYDERNSNSLKLFDEILELKGNTVKVVITTRPVNTEHVTHMVNRAKKERVNISILGLNNDDRKELIRRHTKHLIQDDIQSDQMTDEISLAFRSMAPEMKQILKNPLLLSLFTYLYVDNPNIRNKLTTVTNLFLELTKNETKRLAEKLGIDANMQNTSFWEVLNNWQRILNETIQVSVTAMQYILTSSIQSPNTEVYNVIANKGSKLLFDRQRATMEGILEFEKFYRQWSLRYYLQKKYEVDPHDTQVFIEKCKQLKLNFESVMSNYFNLKHTRKGLYLDKIYCYRHRTEQEFAAAGAICETVARFHKENEGKFIQMTEEGKNVIGHVLESLRDGAGVQKNVKNDTLVMLQTHPWEDELSGVLRFVTGILHNTDEDLLHLLIGDILSYGEHLTTNNQGMTVKRLNISESTDNIDVLLQHMAETNNDSKISDAVARKIENSCGQKELKIRSSQSLSCVSSLLSRFKPTKLAMHLLRDNPEDSPHLISALEAAALDGIELSLELNFQYYLEEADESDKYLEAAKTCVHFLGHLTGGGASIVPVSMKKLDVKLKFEDLEGFSQRLPSLSQLKNLELQFYDDGSFDPNLLTPIPYKGRFFTVYFNTNLDNADNSNLERTAKILNQFWPKNRKPWDGTVLSIKASSQYTGDAVELLLNSLEIQPVIVTRIHPVTEDAMGKEQQLKSLSNKRGFKGDLIMKQ